MAAPAIGRRLGWIPPVHATVDASHPLAAGMQLLVGPQGIDHLSGRSGTGDVTRYGDRFATTAGTGLSFPLPNVNIAGGDFTISVLCRWPSGVTFDIAGYGSMFSSRPTSTVDEIGLWVDGAGSMSYRDLGGGEGPITGTVYTTGRWELITMRRFGAGIDYVRGTSIVATEGSSSSTGSGNPFVIGSSGNGTYSMIGWEVAMVYVATRYVTALPSLLVDPYCALRF